MQTSPQFYCIVPGGSSKQSFIGKAGTSGTPTHILDANPLFS
jgi:hypothetical protein